MVTLPRAVAQQALEALKTCRVDMDGTRFKQQRYSEDTVKKAIAALRQAIEAGAKPCACCGDGNSRLSVTRICDTCGSEYAGQDEMDMAKRIEVEQQPLTDEQIDAIWTGFAAV
jgi:hypothetical protein